MLQGGKSDDGVVSASIIETIEIFQKYFTFYGDYFMYLPPEDKNAKASDCMQVGK